MSEDWVRCRADAGHSRSVCRPNLSLRLRRAEIGSRFLRVPGCDNMAAVDESRFERVPSDPTGSRDLLASPCGRDASSVITLGRVCVEYHRLILGSDAMADISILIVVDGIFSLTTTYPINPTVPPCGPEADPTYGPDPWFTVSHLISTLRNSSSPTFAVDPASRGFNAAGAFENEALTNATADPDATLKGPEPSNPTPFHFLTILALTLPFTTKSGSSVMRV